MRVISGTLWRRNDGRMGNVTRQRVPGPGPPRALMDPASHGAAETGKHGFFAPGVGSFGVLCRCLRAVTSAPVPVVEKHGEGGEFVLDGRVRGTKHHEVAPPTEATCFTDPLQTSRGMGGGGQGGRGLVGRARWDKRGMVGAVGVVGAVGGGAGVKTTSSGCKPFKGSGSHICFLTRGDFVAANLAMLGS